jgi:hypothetical protein
MQNWIQFPELVFLRIFVVVLVRDDDDDDSCSPLTLDFSTVPMPRCFDRIGYTCAALDMLPRRHLGLHPISELASLPNTPAHVDVCIYSTPYNTKQLGIRTRRKITKLLGLLDFGFLIFNFLISLLFSPFSPSFQVAGKQWEGVRFGFVVEMVATEALDKLDQGLKFPTLK